MTRFRDRYQEIYSLLSRAELQRGSEGIAELSLGPDLFGEETEKFLGFYTTDGLQVALRKYGFFRDLERLGFLDFHIELQTDDPDEHMLRLFSRNPDLSTPLVELVVHRSFLKPQDTLASRLSQTHIPVLTVDWLILQNPNAFFTPRRPPLPGQNHPGLGVGAQVLELLRNICFRLQLGGIVTIPSYFHNALFYSEEFLHFDPRQQGIFLGMCRDLMPQAQNSVAAASWALHWKMVKNRQDDQPVSWFQDLMVNPIGDSLNEYFQAPEYRAEVQEGLTAGEFELFGEPLRQNLRRRGIHPFDPDRIQEWLPHSA